MNVSPNAPLRPDQRRDPVLWVSKASVFPARRHLPRADDAALDRVTAGRPFKTWGHDEVARHYLASRASPLHTDPGFTRYSHQWVIRNDGFNLEGLEFSRRLPAGTLYCIDTHSPHRLVPAGAPRGGWYVVLIVDSPKPMDQEAAWRCLAPRARDRAVL